MTSGQTSQIEQVNQSLAERNNRLLEEKKTLLMSNKTEIERLEKEKEDYAKQMNDKMDKMVVAPVPGSDHLHVIIVGHDNQTKCEVANALYREKNVFKQFACDKLNSRKVKKFTFHDTKPSIVTTPCLATPLWQREFKRLREDEEFRNKCFVYVKDMSSVRVNDSMSINAIKRKVHDNDPIVVAIPYHPQKRQQAEKERLKFLDEGLKACLLNLNLSVEGMKTFSKEMFSNVKQLKQQKTLQQSVSNTGDTGKQEVGATGIEQPMSKSLTSTPDDYADEMVGLLDTVKVDDGSLPRPSTPTDSVDLESKHWTLYRRTLSEGKSYSYHTRVNVVGYHAAGKTTLVRRLQKMNLDLQQDSLPSTECLEINKTSSRCIETDKGRMWETHADGYEKDLNFQRMAASLSSTNDLTGLLENDGSDSSSTDENNQYDLNDRFATYESYIINAEEISGSSDTVDDEIENNHDGTLYVRNQIKKMYLSRVMSKVLRSPGMRRYISYWDFAGQSTYYTTHQAFMAPAAVYLLVVDLSKPLEHEIKDSMEFRTHSYQKTTVLDAVRFWAGSIKSFASDENYVIAPIIVVGTHVDKVEDNQKIDSIFEEIKEIIGENELPCIAIDNTESMEDDERLHELRDLILDKALGIFEKQVRAHWIDFEYMLIREKEEGKVLLEFEELEEINKGLDEPISKEEILDFLEHEHCNGFLMHFNAEGLKNIIILQPYILVQFINLLLRKARRTSIRGWNSDGTFDQVFLEDATKGDDILSTHKDVLLGLLVHLKIVFPREMHSKSSTYFMPCLLGERPESSERFESGNYQKSPCIRISFDHRLIPPAFFHTLIVSMMFTWEVDQTTDRRGKTIFHVFYHYCRFKITKSGGTLLEMSWSENQIFLQFINMSTQIQLKEIDCLKHLRTIEKKVADILKAYRHENIIFKLSIKCPEPDHDAFLQLSELLEHKEAKCSGGSEQGCHMVSATTVLSDWILLQSQDVPKADIQKRGLSDEILSRPITKREMVKLSRKIGKDYALLFILLHLDLPTIQRAQADNCSSTRSIIFHLFVDWRKQMGDEATVGKFLEGVREFGHNESAMFDVFL